MRECDPAARSLKSAQEAGFEEADYEVLGKMGEGGMGVIYRARQRSINREVAIKKIKVDVADQPDIRSKFISEAAFTGELAHPNIIPIHELGADDDGTLFYSMKIIEGEPWQSNLPKNTRAENLDILLRVADAIAFAHSRDIIHRDLKPENIMIGKFGEVVVMDLGLATKVTEEKKSAPGGSPAYMAPEMANEFLATMNKAVAGASTDVGCHSDIYLLGAMLFECATGKPPHDGGDVGNPRQEVFNCLTNAAKNILVPPPDKGDPLLDIAYKAMATLPSHRYPSVEAFQAAIREYEAHAQSIGLAERAEEALASAESTRDYDVFARSLFGFRDALELWPENVRAREGEQHAKLAYARAALEKNDFDLGLSLLDPALPADSELHGRLTRRARNRDQRERRLRTFKLAAVGLLVALLGVSTWAYFDSTRKSKTIADSNFQLEQKNTKLSENQLELKNINKALSENQLELQQTNKSLSENQLELQKTNTELAEEKQLAEMRLYQAEYGDFVSSVTSARSNIEESNLTDAITSLARVRANDVTRSSAIKTDWEWKYLNYLSHPEIKHYQLPGDNPSVDLSRDGTLAVVASNADGRAIIQIWDVITQAVRHEWTIDTIESVNDVAITPDGSYAYAACSARTREQPSIVGWSAETGQRILDLKTHLSSDDIGDTRHITIAGDETFKLISSGSARPEKQEKIVRTWSVASDGSLVEEQGLRVYHAIATAISLNPRADVLVSSHRRRDVTQLKVNRFTQPSARAELFATLGLEASGTPCFNPTDPDILACIEFDGVKIYDLSQPADSTLLQTYSYGSPLESIAFAPDGREIICGTSEGELVRFDLGVEGVKSTLGGHTSAVSGCAYRGDHLVSVDEEGGLRFWNLSEYRDELFKKIRNLVSASLSGDGARTVAVSHEAVAIEVLTSHAEGQVVKNVRDQNDILWRHFDASSNRLFTLFGGAENTTLRIWNMAGLLELEVEQIAKDTIFDFVPGGQHVVLSSRRDGVQVLDVNAPRFEKLDVKGGHTALDVASAGADWISRLVYARGIGQVLHGGTVVREARNQDERVAEVFHTPAFDLYVVEKGQRHAIEINPNRPDQTAQQTHISTPEQLSFAKGRLVVVDDQGGLEVWTVRAGAELIRSNPPFAATQHPVKTAVISPNGEEVWLAFSNPSEPEKRFVHIWDLATNQLEQTTIEGKEPIMYAVDDDRILLSGAKHDRLVSRDGRVLQKFGGAMHQAVVADDRSAVLLSTDGVMRIWNTDVNKLAKAISAGPERRIDHVIAASDKEVMTLVIESSSEPNYSIVVWDPKTGEEIRKTDFLPGRVLALNSSPNRCALLMARHGHHVVEVRDIATSQLLSEFPVTDRLGMANCVAISADSSQVAVGQSGGVAVYRLGPSGTMDQSQEFAFNTLGISAIAFSPSGKRIVTGHKNGNVAIWYFSYDSTLSGEGAKWDKLINLRRLHRTQVHTLQFSRRSPAFLLTADENGVAVRFSRDAEASF